MIRNKYIILPFLFLAWTIIFAHSIIPHHHHLHELNAECDFGHETHTHVIEKEEFHDCEHECSDNACHFQIEIITKGAIDNDFVANVNDTYFRNLSSITPDHNIFYDAFISDQIPQTNYLRGPPSIA